jgi:hypothetical protein
MANLLSNIILNGVNKTQAMFASLNRDLTNVENKANSVNGIFGRFLPLLGAATVTGFSKGIIDSADSMLALSQRTGVSVERLAAWDLATKQSETSIEALATAMSKGSRYIVEHGDKLKELGINAKTAEELIFQVADVLSTMEEDDPRRETIVSVLGRGASELLPLLSLGGDELRRMAKEGAEAAKAIALIAPEADELNDGMEKLKQNSTVVGAKVFLPLIKYANDYEEEASEAADTTGFLWVRLKQLANTSTGIALIASLFSDSSESAEETAKSTAEVTAETKKLEGQLRLLNLQLVLQQNNLVKNQKALVAADYKQNIDELKKQVDGFNDLGKSMVSAFQSAGEAAQEALSKSTEFLRSADSIRQSAQDRVSDIDLKDASADDADAVRSAQILDALEKSKSARIQADYQRLLGNTAEAERQLDVAEEQAQRADDITGKLNDEALARQQILDAADALARIDESRAAIQKSIASEETARQESLKQQIAENDQRITDYTARLEQLNAMVKELTNAEADIKVTADQEAINKTLADIEKVKAALASIPKSVTTNVQLAGTQVSNGSAEISQYAYGGILGGHSPHDRADNLLFWGTAGEGVVNRPAMRYYGKSMLDAINSLSLPKYANGGVLGELTLPNVPAANNQSGDTIHMTIPGVGTYEVKASKSTSVSLQRDLRLEVMRRGGRS